MSTRKGKYAVYVADDAGWLDGCPDSETVMIYDENGKRINIAGKQYYAVIWTSCRTGGTAFAELWATNPAAALAAVRLEYWDTVRPSTIDAAAWKAPRVERRDPPQCYVTLSPASRTSDGFCGYVAVLRMAWGWDPRKWEVLPEDPGGDYESPDPTADRTLRCGPESDAALIARSKAITWAQSLGVKYLD
jgi:hypothetical protein